MTQKFREEYVKRIANIFKDIAGALREEFKSNIPELEDLERKIEEEDRFEIQVGDFKVGFLRDGYQGKPAILVLSRPDILKRNWDKLEQIKKKVERKWTEEIDITNQRPIEDLGILVILK